MSYTHLHLHTSYSLLDGGIRIPDLLAKAKETGMAAVAITDHGNLFGAMDFYNQAKKAGIKPIIGCEVYVAPGARDVKVKVEGKPTNHHLVLLCENEAGYRNLCKLVSTGYKDGFYYRPRIDKDILAQHNEGLICLSACLHGEIAQHICESPEKTREAAAWYASTFPGRYYLEIQENTLPEQDAANKAIIQMAREMDLPLVATNDCHYLNQDDYEAHGTLLAMQTKTTMSDPKRMRLTVNEFYVKSPEEMCERFSYIPDAIANTQVIAERCNVEFEFGKYHFPHIEPAPGKTLDQELHALTVAGLTKRWELIQFRNPKATKKEYWERAQLELELIGQMGFPAYFLMVQDFINWAKAQDIPVGPGRGSAAGSLVAYAIGITDIDPIPYDLLFERFLNPERISMPDIDVDFCQNRRGEVVEYVKRKYGADRVSQIITFGTMSARSVVKDVGRAHGVALDKVTSVTSLIPEELGIKLAKAIDDVAEIREMADADPEIKEVLKIALRLEGLHRHVGIHAAGVVVAPKAMEEFCATYVEQKKMAITTQLDMGCVEKIGLVKFDFLGLKTMSVIDRAVKMVKAINPAFDIDRIPLDDKKTYGVYGSGKTVGVFQVESYGMQKLLADLKPTCFEDIIAVLALYRPGPLGAGMVDDFVARKNGAKVSYEIQALEPILKDTYGVIVYQEQVMRIAQVLCGYTLGGADVLRKAMGKKDPEMMAKQRAIFIEGAVKNGHDQGKIETLFDQITKFAEYAFNKSHTTAYAWISYMTAYLKAHYPEIFMSALLTEDMEKAENVAKDLKECKNMKVYVQAPDVNKSVRHFDIEVKVDGTLTQFYPESKQKPTSIEKRTIRYGLGAIVGAGEGSVDAILDERLYGGPFASLEDFCKRIDGRKANKRVVEALIKSGGFDFTGKSRAVLMADLESIGKPPVLQMSLFDSNEPPVIKEWTVQEIIAFEKEALGFSFYEAAHPGRW